MVGMVDMRFAPMWGGIAQQASRLIVESDWRFADFKQKPYRRHAEAMRAHAIIVRYKRCFV